MVPAGLALRVVLAAAFLLAGTTFLAASQAVLEVVSCEHRVLVQHPLAADERWCIAWNHSVTQIPIRDCYVHRDGAMVLERSHQPDFAAGLGHVPGRGRQESDGQGGYWIEDILEPVPGDAYLLRVGSPAVDHRVLLEDGEFSLSRLVPGELVMIRLGGSKQTALADCP